MKNTIIKNTDMKMGDIPFYLRMSYPGNTKMGKTFKFNSVFNYVHNNINCGVQEKQLLGHYGTVLGTVNEIGSNTVCRDDGTSWTINFSLFTDIERVNIID